MQDQGHESVHQADRGEPGASLHVYGPLLSSHWQTERHSGLGAQDGPQTLLADGLHLRTYI